MEQELQTLTLTVCDVAKRAGSFIRNERRQFSEQHVERKHAHDYVSYVDKGSEQLIVAELRALLPQAGFITEEGSATHGEEALLWVIDPLDGTTNFIHGFAPYAVSIALVQTTPGTTAQADSILLGVVYDISADECFCAWQGGGAYVDGQPLHVASHAIADALLCFQLPYDSEAYKPTAQHLIDTFYGRAASIRMLGSAAVALCHVAAGRLDGYAEKHIGQWDYMAGAILVSEAGGLVTDYDGSPHFTRGDSVVATNGLIQQDLLQAIKKNLYAKTN